MIHSPRQRRTAVLSASSGFRTPVDRTPRSHQRGLTFKILTALFAVMAVLVGTAAAAFANAANPLPDASGTTNVKNGVVTQNANGSFTVVSGTVDVQVGGTWNWGDLSNSSQQSDCTSRYGVGWAVDWAGVSNSASAPGALGAIQIGKKNGGGGFFHIFDSDMIASGNNYAFTGPCTAAELALDPPHPSGPWSATHTYTAGQIIPGTLCVNMYDLHGSPGSLKGGDEDPLGNNDNSIKTNSFDPGANKGSCFVPTIINAQHLVGHIYLCDGNNQTTTEVSGGTIGATGPSTVAAKANPIDDTTVKAGNYTVNATSPSDYHFVACGQGGVTIGTPTTANQSTNVPTNGTGTAIFYVVPNPKNPNLSITKAASATTVTAGDSFDYTLNVANTGQGPANNAVVTDTIPTGLAIGKVTPSVGTCTTTGQAVSCNLGNLAANASATITIHVTTSTAVCGKVPNTGHVKADNNGNVDSNEVDVVIVCPNPALDITKSASATTVNAGDPFDYTLVVTSVGGATATNVVVTDTIPTGFGITGASSTTGTCTVANHQDLTCTIGDLAAANAANGTKSATITVHISTNNAPCGTLPNTAHAAAGNVSNVDSNEVDVTVDCPVNGNLDKTNDADADGNFHKSETAPLPGMDVPFRAVLTNTSGIPVVIDSIQDDWTDATGALSISPQCAAAFVGQTVAPGDSLTCEFVVSNYSPAAGTSVTNTITVNVHDAGNPGKTKTLTSTSTVNTAATPPLNLTVTKTNDGNGDGVFTKDETGVENANVNFRVTITNNSAVPVVIDSVTDVWPGATEFAPACAAQIVGTTLAANGGTVSCDFTVANYVPSSTAGAKTNTVTVKAHDASNPGNTTTQKDDSTVRGEPPAVLGTTVVRALPRTGSDTYALAGLGVLLLALGAGLMMLSSGRIPQAAMALRSSVLTAPVMYSRSVLVERRSLGAVNRRKLRGR